MVRDSPKRRTNKINIVLRNLLSTLFLNVKIIKLLPMNVSLVYASTSGNVEATMENIAARLSEANFKCELLRVEKIDFSVFQKNSFFILATSTWDHGIINPFWDKMLSEFEKNSLSGKKSAFVGLGDFRYEPVYFCRGIDTLRDAFLKAGGEQVGVSLKVNGDPYEQFEKLVKIWTDNLIKQLQNAS
jgi:flavodoxin